MSEELWFYLKQRCKLPDCILLFHKYDPSYQKNKYPLDLKTVLAYMLIIANRFLQGKLWALPAKLKQKYKRGLQKEGETYE